MIRTVQIAVKSDSRPQTKDQRLQTTGSGLASWVLRLGSCVLLSCLAGCTVPEEEPIWQNVKIGDLAPYDAGKPAPSRLLKTVSLDLNIFEIPADNIGRLDDIRKVLLTKGLRFSNFAFDENSFSVRLGQTQMWNEIQNLLLGADGRKIAKVSLMLFDGQAETIAVTRLNGSRTIFFTATDGSKHGANVGSGVLGLRIVAEKIPGSRGVCNITAYPVFSRPARSSIPQLDARAKLREFPFDSAAFALNMSPDDLVLLGPKEYISDQTDLGGLFFSDPQGSLFFNDAERKPPEIKPAVRIFVLVCTGINF